LKHAYTNVSPPTPSSFSREPSRLKEGVLTEASFRRVLTEAASDAPEADALRSLSLSLLTEATPEEPEPDALGGRQAEGEAEANDGNVLRWSFRGFEKMGM
jgi:hypothetical protein